MSASGSDQNVGRFTGLGNAWMKDFCKSCKIKSTFSPRQLVKETYQKEKQCLLRFSIWTTFSLRGLRFRNCLPSGHCKRLICAPVCEPQLQLVALSYLSIEADGSKWLWYVGYATLDSMEAQAKNMPWKQWLWRRKWWKKASKQNQPLQ